jgi:Uma2 family endonuclease
MAANPERQWTAADYLAFERASTDKHEFIGGRVVAMSGASAAHNLIAGNALASLHSQLRKRPCTVYPSDLRVKVARKGAYTYPDVTVVCGEAQFEDVQQDTLLNPTLIIAVLLPSTENYDRGKKFQHYRRLDSLQEYVLIAQDARHIERYLRQADGTWALADLSDGERGDGRLALPSIGCVLTLDEVYEKVTVSEA